MVKTEQFVVYGPFALRNQISRSYVCCMLFDVVCRFARVGIANLSDNFPSSDIIAVLIHTSYDSKVYVHTYMYTILCDGAFNLQTWTMKKQFVVVLSYMSLCPLHVRPVHT